MTCEFRDLKGGDKFTHHGWPGDTLVKLDEDNPGGNSFNTRMGRLYYFSGDDNVERIDEREVFIILGHFDHEGDTVLGVRFNREAAVTFVKEYVNKYFSSIRVERWTEAGSELVSTFC